MKFNTFNTLDFLFELQIPEFQNNIPITEETKLFGGMITSDLKWEAHKNYIFGKALQKMWVLRRLKRFKVNEHFLIDVYKKDCV